MLPELVDVHDVGVVQLNADPRLVDEHRDELFVLRHRGEDLLDGEDALEPFDAEGLGDEDLGHAADVDPLEQQVLAEEGGLLHRADDAGSAAAGSNSAQRSG